MISKQINIIDFLFVIQARLGSSRLPAKVMLSLGKYTVLETLINNLENMGIPKSQIVIATSDEPMDDVIASAFAQRVKIIRGNEQNVLDRFQKVSKSYPTKYLVRLTGDNPFPDDIVLNRCLEQHQEKEPDITSTRFIDSNDEVMRYVPKGKSIDIISVQKLLSLQVENCSSFDQEHVIPPFFRERYEIVKEHDGHEAYSIDTVEDYIRAYNKMKSLE